MPHETKNERKLGKHRFKLFVLNDDQGKRNALINTTMAQ